MRGKSLAQIPRTRGAADLGEADFQRRDQRTGLSEPLPDHLCAGRLGGRGLEIDREKQPVHNGGRLQIYGI